MLKKQIKAALRGVPGLRRIADKFDEASQKIMNQEAEMQILKAQVLEADRRISDQREIIRATEIQCDEAKRCILKQEKAICALEERLSAQMQNMDYLKCDIDLLFRQVLNENDASVLAKKHMAAVAENVEKPRLAVYTVLMGEYDVLHAPAYVDSYCDYFCFTNVKGLKSSFWKIIYIENEEGQDNIRFQRKLKLSPHLLFPEYEHSLYVDASILIHKSVWDWIESFSTGKALLAYQHPERNCIYTESEACISLAKDSSDIIMAQMERYRQCEYPENNGLIWSAILYRKHHDQTLIRVHQTWLEEIQRGSRRDQLSFNYACWKNRFSYDEATGDYRDYFLWACYHDGKFR